MWRTELELAKRLGWRADNSKRLPPAVAVAIAGIALAMLVMLLSVSIMLGFKDEVTRRIINLNDAITIHSVDSTFTADAIVSLLDLPAQAQTTAHASLPAILKTPTDFLGLELQRNDDLNIADTAIVLSESSTAKLRLNIGDRVPAYFFINERLRVRQLTLTQNYNSGFAEHDDAVAYCAPTLPAELLNFPPDQVQALGIRNIPTDQIDPLTSGIYTTLLNAYYSGQLSGSFSISNVLRTDANFFSWLALLDTNVIVIITLMTLVAAFTIISSLIIIILERVKTIGLLKSLGANNSQIRHIFMLMAEKLVVRGLLLGNLLALGLILLQKFTHLIPLDPASYYVDFVPVRLSLSAILALNLGAITLSWLALMLPAAIIARISPSTTLRYE